MAVPHGGFAHIYRDLKGAEGVVEQPLSEDGSPAQEADYYNPPASKIRDWGAWAEPLIEGIPVLSDNIRLDDIEGGQVTIGVGARPTPLITPGAALLTGGGTVTVGPGALASAANNVTFSNFIGYLAGALANNLYCSNGVGLRVLRELLDGQYADAFGTDAGLHLVYARNAALFAAKAGLYKTDIRNSLIAGTGAAYAGGTVLDSLISGNSACDGGQPVDFDAAQADPHNIIACLIHGNFAARFLKAPYNQFTGQGAASLTTITGSYNWGDGRQVFPHLEGGVGNAAFADGSGGGIVNGSYNTLGGFQVSLPGDYSNVTALGYQSGGLVTGPNQVQLGGPGTTPYASAALAVRSDREDKKKIRDLNLKVSREIVLGARWRSFVMDLREAYHETVTKEIEVEEDRVGTRLVPTAILNRAGEPVMKEETFEFTETVRRTETEIIEHPSDGSKAGKRRHAGVIAQDEAARLAKAGIDFAGLKNGAHDGKGRDVWELQYEQYIPHMGALLQDMEQRLTDQAAELSALRNEVAELRSAAG